jgi:hypothetical protein
MNANACTYTSTVAAPPSAADFAAIERAIAAAGPEPIGEWMRDQGFPPDRCLLILPLHMRRQMGAFPPNYVNFTQHVEQPVLTHDILGLSAMGDWLP